ncbi:unnamed protein product [Orchesella dallaii]|uniref:Glucose-methanol-choline oxidoreductase N-terminal domain-containing protein n=1 Tax=Orchesella dallaii TaxID=48710 RepID=A0ABP1QBT4_9HEXA
MKKIHFDEALRAVGVTFVRHGVKGYAHANKEIIVSGGAINSPHLLMLSGVGPRDHLIEHRISPIVDLPVGLNLQDHVTTIIGPFIINTTDSFLLHRDLDIGALFSYAKDGSGPVSSPMGIMALGLTSTSFAPSPNWPDIMYTVFSLGVFPGLAELMETRFNLKDAKIFLDPVLGEDSHLVIVSLGLPKSRGYIRLKDRNPMSKPLIDPRYYSDPENQDFKAMVEGTSLILQLYENTTSLQKINAHLSHPYPGCGNPDLFPTYVILVTLGLPKSRGFIRLRDNNPLSHPIIDPQYFTDAQDADIKAMVKGVQLIVDLYENTTALQKLDAHLPPTNLPGCENYVLRSPEYYECFVKTVTITNYHPAASCPMGRPYDPNAVVDSQLRTNTNAPSIMIGEMCADMVKKTWNLL